MKTTCGLAEAVVFLAKAYESSSDHSGQMKAAVDRDRVWKGVQWAIDDVCQFKDTFPEPTFAIDDENVHPLEWLLGPDRFREVMASLSFDQKVQLGLAGQDNDPQRLEYRRRLWGYYFAAYWRRAYAPGRPVAV